MEQLGSQAAATESPASPETDAPQLQAQPPNQQRNMSVVVVPINAQTAHQQAAAQKLQQSAPVVVRAPHATPMPSTKSSTTSTSIVYSPSLLASSSASSSPSSNPSQSLPVSSLLASPLLASHSASPLSSSPTLSSFSSTTVFAPSAPFSASKQELPSTSLLPTPSALSSPQIPSHLHTHLSQTITISNPNAPYTPFAPVSSFATSSLSIPLSSPISSFADDADEPVASSPEHTSDSSQALLSVPAPPSVDKATTSTSPTTSSKRPHSPSDSNEQTPVKKQKQSNVKKRKRKSKSDTQQTKHETRECDGEDLFDVQEDDTPREERNKYAAVSSFSKWTSQDDLQLKDAIQGAPDFEYIARHVRFSIKFSAEQIKQRWSALLYDSNVAVEAAAAMSELPSINRRVLWSEHEENILRNEALLIQQGQSNSFICFQTLLEKNRAQFHSSRTAKSLEAHYYRMKRQGTLSKKSGEGSHTPISSRPPSPSISPQDSASSSQRDERIIEVDQMEVSVETSKNSSPKSAVVSNGKNEGKKQQRRLIQLGIEKEEREREKHMLARLSGRFVRYEMKSKEILLGRNTSDTVVDIDLNEEGNASKVSRLQAMIKLKQDGDFYLKNLGRSIVFIDGKRVPNGKCKRLPDCCLIEVQQMSLVFDINKPLHSKIKKMLSL